MRVLLIGGTGNISTAVTQELAERGVDVTVFNRGTRDVELPGGVHVVAGDIRDLRSAREALGSEEFDVVVDWLAYVPEHVETDIDLFSGRIAQYVYISSATVYRRPSIPYRTPETAPLGNAHWKYAQDKIACEERLRREHEERGFPVTVVRPSYTYGERWIPAVIAGQDYTLVDRMLNGRPVISPGDGQSLWTMTHNTDFARAFAGILGREDAVGEAFTITSDDVLTWDQIIETIAAAAGTEADIVHVPSDFMAAVDPELGANLLGDKSHSAVFDTSKIKRFVPGWEAVVPFREGVERSLAWFDADPSRKVVDPERNELIDRIVDAYLAGFPGSQRVATA
ncbi:MAG TPA: SDR family oxidoreductase [Gaiellaceae bacterium]|jgi:nucleoside-diphosphate-sugar epimerase|nr:SDR family oxidoreductase [Gaiellaceae bacterium]